MPMLTSFMLEIFIIRKLVVHNIDAINIHTHTQRYDISLLLTLSHMYLFMKRYFDILVWAVFNIVYQHLYLRDAICQSMFSIYTQLIERKPPKALMLCSRALYSISIVTVIHQRHTYKNSDPFNRARNF